MDAIEFAGSDLLDFPGDWGDGRGEGMGEGFMDGRGYGRGTCEWHGGTLVWA